jgi:hypothetical protein
VPEVVKYGRCEHENMEIALEALRNGDIGLNAANVRIHFENIPAETLRWSNVFCCGKYSS